MELINLINQSEEIPVKGVLSDLEPYLKGNITIDDSNLIKEIAYYFC
jgi:hypothetical protein